ncbi:ribosome biogenesis GTPase [Desulfonatronum zhilinae]|nr:ribosome biogenesis GTPase [Desulfonatronum zhilinae]
MNLHSLGWTSSLTDAFASRPRPGLVPARVSREDRGVYTLLYEHGRFQAEVSGKLRHRTAARADYPAVGDWVVTEPGDASSRGVIHELLPRRSAFIRRMVGGQSQGQVVAANADIAFLVSGLDREFNPRRIERYLTLAWESGADPVVLLNKADLHAQPELARLQAEAIAPGVAVFLISAATGDGLRDLLALLGPGRTGVLLGSSGVGKSSIVNALIGREARKTSVVREADGRGRHTTTHRQLMVLPTGAMLIDTPGLREIQLLADEKALDRSFEDIDELAASCRFRDCSHNGEPDCAVQHALAEGLLEMDRYESWLRQCKETRFHQREQDVLLRIQEKKRWKTIQKTVREVYRYKGR